MIVRSIEKIMDLDADTYLTGMITQRRSKMSLWITSVLGQLTSTMLKRSPFIA